MQPLDSGLDPGLDSVRWNKYLRGSDYPKTWAKLAEELSGSNNAQDTAVSLLGSAGLGELFQLDTIDAENPDEVRGRGEEVLNRLRTATTSTRNKDDRESATDILAGFQALEAANPAWSATSTALVDLAARAESKKFSAQIRQLAEDLAARNPHGFVFTSEADKLRSSRGIPDSTQQALASEITNQSLTLIEEISPRTLRLIRGAFPRGIMEMIQPEALNKGSEFSIFEAAIDGGSPVTINDFESAISYFTRFPDQADRKSAASRIRSMVTTDEELQHSVVAYYLQYWKEQTDDKGFNPSVAGEQLREMGVVQGDVDKLIGSGSTVAVNPGLSQETAERMDRDNFGAVRESLKSGQLATAKARLDQILASGEQPRSTVGVDIVEDVNNQLRRLERDTQGLAMALQAGDSATARRELVRIQDYCTDSAHVDEMERHLLAMEHDPQRLSFIMGQRVARIDQEGMRKPLGIVPESASTLALAPLVIMLPAVILDSLFPEQSFFNNLFLMAILSGATIFGLPRLDNRAGRWIVLGLLVFVGFSTGFFAPLALIALYAAAATMKENSERNRDAKRWNALMDATFGELMQTGLNTPTAGLYAAGQRLLPVEAPAQPVPGDGVYFVNRDGHIADGIPTADIRRMSRNQQFVAVNAWANQI